MNALALTIDIMQAWNSCVVIQLLTGCVSESSFQQFQLCGYKKEGLFSDRHGSFQVIYAVVKQRIEISELSFSFPS
jgi:hypothetical protein